MCSALTIAPLPEPEWNRYDELLCGLDDALPCQGLSWLRMVSRAAGCEPGILGAFRNGRLEAALPYCVSVDLGGGRVLNSLPFFGSHGGVLSPEPLFGVAAPLLLEELTALAGRLSCRSATVISSPFTPDPDLCRRAFSPDLEDERICQMVYLPECVETLMPSYSPCKRNNIRRALQLGVQVHTSRNLGDWQWARRTHHGRMEAIGGVAKPEAFFQWAWEGITDGSLRFLVADAAGEPCAALLLASHGGTVEYLLPASAWDKRQYKGLQLLIYESMRQAVNEGRRRYNFGGTWRTQQSLHEFKSRFGARDVPYTYFVRIYDWTLLKATRQELTQFFPFQYVLPFDRLEPEAP